MALNWYYRRIIQVLECINTKSHEVLPANRKAVNSFLEMNWLVDSLLSGLRDPSEMNDINWDYNPLFGRFRSHLLEQEVELEKSLRTATYYLDDDNTLQLITHGKQPEKVRLLHFQEI